MSTRQTVTALYRLTALCLFGWLPTIQLAANDGAEVEAQPDPELLMFIAAFSDQGQFLDPQALDQMMMQIDTEPVIGSDAESASAQTGSQQSGDSNDQDEETVHEQL